MNDVTLQINLSAGDAAYAAATVPALLATHSGASERLLVVDLCKPQATGIVDPAKRFPEPAYSERQANILALAERWEAEGLVDRVVTLRAGDPIFPTLRRRYLRPWLRETHDYGGCALMAYLAAFEFCRTRWLLHFDADMLVHQTAGFDWVGHAQTAMADNATIVAAVPRPSAPPPLGAVDAPTHSELLALHVHPSGWINTWFSTRCYLFDLERLRPCLPLLQGRIYWETLVARLFRRGYPRSPEIMLFRRLSAARRWRLTLNDRRAWLLHPTKKDAAFVAAVAAGRCPDCQRGRQDLELEYWSGLLA